MNEEIIISYFQISLLPSVIVDGDWTLVGSFLKKLDAVLEPKPFFCGFGKFVLRELRY